MAQILLVVRNDLWQYRISRAAREIFKCRTFNAACANAALQHPAAQGVFNA